MILTYYQISYMISAWARMCKIFGTEFTQYLPLVMPSVMKAASIKPEVAVIDGLCQKYFSINFEISSIEMKNTKGNLDPRVAHLEDKRPWLWERGCTNGVFAKPWFECFLDILFSSRIISQALADSLKVVTQLNCNKAVISMFGLHNLMLLSKLKSCF